MVYLARKWISVAKKGLLTKGIDKRGGYSGSKSGVGMRPKPIPSGYFGAQRKPKDEVPPSPTAVPRAD